MQLRIRPARLNKQATIHAGILQTIRAWVIVVAESNHTEGKRMLGWIKYVYVQHWMPFALLAATWLSGYIIHANLKSPLIVLYYAAHIFSAVAFIAVGMFHLHPDNRDTSSRLHPSAPNNVVKATHRAIYYILRIQPVIGVLIFYVPDSGRGFGKRDSFWFNHVYNDNIAHMIHAMLFYSIIGLGLFNFMFALNKRRKGR
jgi:hypothetical protein